MTTARTYLAGIKERAANQPAYSFPHEAQQDRAKLLDALLAVLDLHEPVDVEVFDNPTTNGSHIEYQCQVCDETAYPCATMTALEASL